MLYTRAEDGNRMSGWDRKNSPMDGSKVNPLTPHPVE